MTVEVRFHSLQPTPWLEKHVLRRLDRRLGRFRHRIGRVVVRLLGSKGPDGKVTGKHCRVEIRGQGLGSIAVAESGADIYAAVDAAARRAADSVGRKESLRRRKLGFRATAA